VFSEALTGEPLALDLVNTVAGPPGNEVDLLGTPAALRAWLTAQQARLGSADGEIDLEAVHALRAHIAAAIHAACAGQPPPPTALRAITAALRNAPAHQELGWDGETVTTTPRRTGNPTTILLAQLAAAAAELLASPAIRQVRRCEGRNCRMLFLPASPRRRWCSPTVCGNRARVTRYYQRHKN
jgi:predicted RNA-binding Zn ribbon-like protein